MRHYKQFLENCESEDDQGCMYEYALKYPERIHLDTKQEFISNLPHAETCVEKSKDGTLYNKCQKTKTCGLHGPGTTRQKYEKLVVEFQK